MLNASPLTVQAIRDVLKAEALRQAEIIEAMRPSRIVDQFGRPIMRPVVKIGDTITVRCPARFQA